MPTPFEEENVRKRYVLLLTLYCLTQGSPLRVACAQSVAPVLPPMPRIVVTPIPQVGSLVTIQPQTHIDFQLLKSQHISDDHVRSLIRGLPHDAKVIEMRSGTGGRPSRFLIRESESVWREAPTMESRAVEAPPMEPTTPETRVLPPVLWLTVAGSGEDYKILTQLVPPNSGQNSWGWPEVGPFAILSADKTQALDELLRNNPSLIIHRGGLLPHKWYEVIKNSGRPYVRVTPDSPNQDFSGIQEAAELGGQRVASKGFRILSALPKLDGWLSGYWELYRMDLRMGQRDAWERLLTALKNQSLLDRMSPITKDSLQSELLGGSGDVVFVIAHNKLAKTVFASPTDVDASTLPALMKDLLSEGGELRRTLEKYSYLQFVLRLTSTYPNA